MAFGNGAKNIQAVAYNGARTVFETCFMVTNDDLKSKTTHFSGFYTQTISASKILKPAHSVTQRDAIATVISNT